MDLEKTFDNMTMKLFHKNLNRHVPVNVNEKVQGTLGFQDRIALFVTTALGTMWAVYGFGIIMLAWIIWQFVLHEQAFDPYPFAFLLFLGNIVQLLLMPLIMVGQNVQSKHSELRAEESYKTTTSSFHDIEHVMAHLDALDKELVRQSYMLEQLLQKNSSSADGPSAIS